MHSWIVDHLKTHFEGIKAHLNNDMSLKISALAALNASKVSEVCFGLVSSYLDEQNVPCVIVRVGLDSDDKYDTEVTVGSEDEALFSLGGRSDDWQEFFQPKHKLVRPYQSFWGMLRVLSPTHPAVRVIGDTTAFARFARVWRLALDRMRDAVNEVPVPQSTIETIIPEEEELDEDYVSGKYLWVEHSEYGKVKIFHEVSGHGAQTLLFLHTAGSDSRQYHSLMNQPRLRERCKMIAFDLPAHGRSSFGSKQQIEGYTLTEEAYIESIKLVIERLQLKGVVVCGASMAGHVCLAAAVRAEELSLNGVIPCEGCVHLPFSQPIYEIRGNDSAILDPERVCGMIAPTSPEYYKQQIWWQYSSQGTGVFSGDLRFYFRGWDGRGRIEKIDTKRCPVYMLTGEYDYSCTVEASRATADMIDGAVFEEMKGLGHFPLTENPAAVLPYLMRALDHIAAQKVTT